MGLGLWLLGKVEDLVRDPDDRQVAKGVFMAANSYLMLLYAAMAVDSLVVSRLPFWG
jgi:heme O synthase-like polyprenyltransferase